jgi:hypothetical protein
VPLELIFKSIVIFNIEVNNKIELKERKKEKEEEKDKKN